VRALALFTLPTYRELAGEPRIEASVFGNPGLKCRRSPSTKRNFGERLTFLVNIFDVNFAATCVRDMDRVPFTSTLFAPAQWATGRL
jgi:hypothetical protein